MKVVVFGNGSFASLVWFWLCHDSPYTVVAFTVDAAHLSGGSLQGLPVVPFERVAHDFPPDDHSMLLPIGPVANNTLRSERCAAARVKGYGLVSYLSSRAIVPPGLELRENSMIFEGAVIQPFASIGSNVIVRAGAQISHHVVVEDGCFVASGVCIGGGARIGVRCFLGLNATILNDIEVAPGSTVAAGAVLRKSATEPGVYAGNPARRYRG